ncbi:carbohydrate ABC transporter permease [Cohnella silvisoli]|uniref:Carbohydrate ABC transporter permease n=1 Tax=Cohnella silvisoli TaxID=2873699 RepID=A0ABV1KX38_9BACL|nr:carbohydrate ABC transporter permease [Cohnella silvisoli]MCD9023538.1 carbohydrate ABC transporter permease [Cohnella silvisoli]
MSMWISNLGGKVFKVFPWLYCIISIYPLVYMLFFSLKSNEEILYQNPFGIPHVFHFDNYSRAVKAFNILLFFKNSVIVSFASLIGIILFSITFAYAASRMEWRLNKWTTTYMLMGLFIPIQSIMIPLSLLVKNFHLANSYFSLIVPYISFNLSFSVLIFYGFFRTIPPEMEESAFMDGAGIARTFVNIILPIMRPAIATVIIFSFMGVWNEFTMATVLISDAHFKTLPVGLVSFTGARSSDYGGMGAAMVMASIPTFVVYLIFSEQVEKALTVGSAVKG